jgi:CheY-like chemotaxis protein
MAAKILLVDDDVDFVAITKTFLSAAGYTVLTAYDGDECLAIARAERPDVIVLDYMITRPTEGSYVAQEIRRDPVLNRTPIVLLTSVRAKHPWWRVERNDTNLPVDILLDKPVSAEKLVEAVSQMVASQA